MKSKTVFLMLLLCSIVNAQNIRCAYDSKEIKGLLASTLYIIPTGDKTFDDSLLVSMKRYWKVTPYQVLSASDIESAIKDEDKYFIAPVNSLDKFADYRTIGSPLTTKITMRGREFYLVATIYIFHGSKHNKANKMDFAIDITSCGLPFGSGVNGAMGLDYVVKNLEDNIHVVVDNKMDPIKHAAAKLNPEVNQDFSVNAEILKDRTLLIPESLTEFVLKEKFLSAYKFKYKIAPLADIISLLNSADAKNYCFIPDYVSTTIEVYDPVTKAKIYSGETGVMAQIREGQVEDFNKAVSGSGKKKKK